MSSLQNTKKVLYPSPLRYPGGKTKLSSFIAEVLASKNSNEVIFVEPFAGGAGAALSLLFANKVSKIIINDLDPAIYAFWKTAVFNTDKFIDKIKHTKICMQEWEKQREIYKNPNSEEFVLGFATFFLNRTNRSGIIEAGPIGGYDQLGKWKINARFNKDDLINRLKKLKSYRKQINVINKDGISLLSELEEQVNAKKLFIFLDPPYIKKGQLLYLNHYKKENHKNLSDFLQGSKLDWIMTYDDTSYIRELYSKKELKGFSIPYSAFSRKKGKEVLISPRIIRERIKIGG